MKRHRIVLPCVLGVGLLGCQTVPRRRPLTSSGI